MVSKKILLAFILGLLIFPFLAFAAPSSVNRLVDHIEPLNPTDYIKATFFTATSTTATSSFPNASTTKFRIGADFITDITGTGLSITNGVLNAGVSSFSNWQKETNFAVDTLTPSTTIPVWIKDALYASSSLTVQEGFTSIGDADTTGTLNSSAFASELFLVSGDGTAQLIADSTDSPTLDLTNSVGRILFKTTGDSFVNTLHGFAVGNSSTSVLFGVGSSSPNKITEAYRAIFGAGQLEIDGTTWLDGAATIGASTTIANLTAANCDLKATVTGGLYCGTDVSSAGGSGSVGTSSLEISGYLPLWTTSATTPALLGNSRLFQSAGNIGIGSSSPSALLSIHATSSTGTPVNLFTIASSSGGLSTTTLFNVNKDAHFTYGTTTVNLVNNGVANVWSIATSTTAVPAISIDNTGTTPHVGIGTNAPQQTFHVEAPGASMELRHPVGIGNGTAIMVINAVGSAVDNQVGAIQFENQGGTFAQIDAYRDSAASSNFGRLEFMVGNNSANTIQNTLYLKSNGRLSIGSTTPTAKFTIHAPSTDTGNTLLFAIGSSTSLTSTTHFTVNNSGSTTITNLSAANCALKATVLGGIYCGTDATGAGASPDWIKQTNFGADALTPSTTIPVWLQSALYASTTAVFDRSVTIGSSTPWGMLSVASSTYNYLVPMFSVATSSGATGQLLSVFATTSIMTKTGNAANNESGARVLIGRGPFTPVYLDQLQVAGRINPESLLTSCDVFNGSVTQLVADTNYVCSNFMFNEDAAGVFDLGASTSSSPYARLRTGATGVSTAAGDGASLTLQNTPNTTIIVASSTPVVEVTARIGDPRSATSTIYFIGMTSLAGDNDVVATPNDACAFTASSSASAGNWWLMSRNSGTATYVNTGVPSSTTLTTAGSFYRFRLEISGTNCVGYITNLRSGTTTRTAIAATNSFPNRANFVASVGSVSAKIADELHIRTVRMWLSNYNEPL